MPEASVAIDAIPLAPLIAVNGVADPELAERLREFGLRLTVGEARKIVGLLGRDPTRVELTLFDTMWSEHCSYKSSRAVLKEFLPVEAPNVILGPGEDAGIIYLTTHKGERYALVVAHESHNHPSQVVPAEGAATGIGGIVRDVYCMGADVVGVLDALRFGDLRGERAETCREIANGVITGIWQYGNALGVPNLGGDITFDRSFDENCLVNVVAVGVVRERDIIRSRVPAEAAMEPYVLILLGKPTDASGFGGAAFSSAVLDEEAAEQNKGAVQLPDPFLKRVLAEANRAALALCREEGVVIGFKDLGAGGIACVSSELAAHGSPGVGSFGMDVDLDRESVDGGPFPPEVLACSETQERFGLVVPERLAEAVARVYNVDFELPRLYPGGGARIIGRVRTDGRYRLLHQGVAVVDAPVEAVTEGIRYDRVAGVIPAPPAQEVVEEPEDFEALLRDIVAHPNVASREHVFRHYDTEVQGRAIFRPGEADAALFLPVVGCPMAVAVSVDGNPAYGKLDPFWGGATAVAEAMRNVAAVGATPQCLTDCLNFGNPEDPAVFGAFREAVRGLGEAARRLGLKGEEGVPLPFVSGNVSLYNQSAAGRAILPSPIVACFGLIDDYSRAVTSTARETDSHLLLIGDRRRELGGSVYHDLRGVAGGRTPTVEWETERAAIHGVIDAIDRGLVLACHDISEGGLAVALFEMLVEAPGGGVVDLSAASDDSEAAPLTPVEILFSETGGFVLEVAEDQLEAVESLFVRRGVKPRPIGHTQEQRRLKITTDGTVLVEAELSELIAAWRTTVPELLT